MCACSYKNEICGVKHPVFLLYHRLSLLSIRKWLNFVIRLFLSYFYWLLGTTELFAADNLAILTKCAIIEVIKALERRSTASWRKNGVL